MINKKIFGIVFSVLLLVLSLNFVLAVDDLMALQGNVKKGTSNVDGNLTVAIYDAYSGGSLIYNSTTDFNGAINDGKYDVMLGNGSNELTLEYGKFYYIELYVNNEKFTFNGSDRQVFQSSVGNINATNLIGAIVANETTDNVGIGTSIPTQKLEVRGIGNFSETIYINNATDVSVWLYNHTSDTYTLYNAGWSSTYNATYAGHATDGVVIKYQNISNLPTCGAGEHLDYDGATLSCTADTTTMDYTNIALTNISEIFDEGLIVTKNVSIGRNLSVNGTTLFVNTDLGRIGIGTTNPGAKLDIREGEIWHSTSNAYYFFKIDTNAVAANSINFIGPYDFTWLQYDLNPGDGNRTITLGVPDSAANKVIINPDGGNVGIGTTSPDSLLTIDKVVGTNELNVSGVLFVNSTSGRVGIGTTSPSAKLHISNGVALYDDDRNITNLYHLVDKIYVDEAVTALGARYYMFDADSGEADYKNCSSSPSVGAEQSFNKASLSDDDYILGWIAPNTNEPDKLITGVYNWRIYAEKTAGTETLRLYWKLVERKSDTSEDVIGISIVSNEITSGKNSYIIPLTISADHDIASDSYVVGKIYADVSGSGSAPSVTLYYEGNSDSHWEIPVNTEILDDRYVNADGDTLTGTLNLPANGLIAGTNQLVLSGGNVGIGTTSPKTTINTVGTFNMTNGTNQVYHNATCVIITGESSVLNIC